MCPGVQAPKHNVKSIVFSSSATVYSGDNEMPLRENSKTGNCTNPYGWTKYMCEQILRDLVEFGKKNGKVTAKEIASDSEEFIKSFPVLA